MSETPIPKRPTNYGGNSKIDRDIAAEEEVKDRKIKKIEGLKVTKVKKSLGSRIAENFGGQNLRSVGAFLLVTVIIPKSKDLLMDLIQEGGHRTIYGDTRRSTPSSSGLVGSSRIRPTNYSTISSRAIVGSTVSTSGAAISPRDAANHDFSGLVIPDRAQAEEVLERLGDAIEEFGMVTLADFYDLLEVTGNGFTDAKFGWNDISKASVIRVRDGWILNLPQPRPIDN